MDMTSSRMTRPDRRSSARLACACAMALLAVQGAAVGKEIFRWVDEDGQVQYGHAIPPQYKDQEIETLNKQGVVTGKQPRAPTAAELKQMELEAERSAVREELARRKAEYRDNLFKSYATVNDLEAYHKSRMDALYYRQSINDHKVSELRRTLSELMTEAQDFNFPYSAESPLPPIPQDLLLEMQTASDAMRARQEDAENLRRKLMEQERKFESDLAIFRKYGSPESIAQGAAEAAGGRR